jgi:hypothetical protein
VFAASWFHPATRQGHSRQDQGDDRERGHGDALTEDQDAEHTGNTLAGEARASLRELMDRMGHSITRAALIYQHRTSLRDRMIADEISRRAEAERPRSGTQRVRDNGEAS